VNFGRGVSSQTGYFVFKRIGWRAALWGADCFVNTQNLSKNHEYCGDLRGRLRLYLRFGNNGASYAGHICVDWGRASKAASPHGGDIGQRCCGAARQHCARLWHQFVAADETLRQPYRRITEIKRP
jgi:hypothetical protein